MHAWKSWSGIQTTIGAGTKYYLAWAFLLDRQQTLPFGVWASRKTKQNKTIY